MRFNKWLITLLLSVVGLLNLYHLGLNDIWQPNEAFYAETAREILERGNWLDLTYNYEPRLNKPPMTYWLTAVSYKIFGISEWTTRLTPLLSALFTALLLFYYGRKIKDALTGLFAAVVFLTALQVFSLARYDSPEMPLTFFLTGALVFYHLHLRERKTFFLLLSGIFLSAAILTKGIPFLAIFWGTIFLYHLLEDLLSQSFNLLRFLKKMFKPLLVGFLASLPTLGWYYYAYLHYGELFVQTFYSEVIHRAINPHKGFNWSFYLVVILWAFLPYSLHFYYSLLGYLLKKLKEEKEFLFSLSWFLTTFGAFTVAKGKIPVYILPAFGGLAILTARLYDKYHRAISVLNALVLVILVVAFVYALFWLGFADDLLLWIVLFLSLALWAAVEGKHYLLRPAIAVIPILVLFTYKVLPWVEQYRPYKEVITQLKDQYGDKKFVCLNWFFKDFPFYWRGKVYIIRSEEGLKKFDPKKVLLFTDKPLKGWKVVKKVELYTGSESRFLVMLKDLKTHRRFKEFYFQVKE
jgi:4-amino-4-deoxy-L-arabinose transferase-like glycosyltransferase